MNSKKEFLAKTLIELQQTKIVIHEEVLPQIYSSKEEEFNVFDWLELADPEHGLDIDREYYEVKYGELE